MTLSGNATINAATAAAANSVVFEGPVTFTGALNKFGPGTLQLGGSGGSGSGGTVINAGLVQSIIGSGTPFGAGAITINPGGIVRLADSSNAPSGGITVNSDVTGLGVIGLGYNGAAPTITANNSTDGGPFAGVVGIDAVGFSTTLNMATLAGGSAFLGSSGTGNFTAGTLTASTSTAGVPSFITSLLGGVSATYRLGGGAGSLSINSSGVLASAGSGNSVLLFGALNNTYQATSIAAMTNGGGTVIINNPQTNLTSNTFALLNTGETLQIGNNSALGTATLVTDGGILQPDATGLPTLLAARNISNNIVMAGDVIFGAAATSIPVNEDFTLSGTIALSNSTMGSGLLRNFTTASTASGNLINLTGVISDGSGTGNQINKAGAGILVLSGNNTYHRLHDRYGRRTGLQRGQQSRRQYRLEPDRDPGWRHLGRLERP